VYGLSKISGVTHSSISKIEAGVSQPYWFTLLKLAAAFNSSPHDIDDTDARKNIRICSIYEQEFRFNPSEDTKTCGNQK
jgi:DNA-binding XRE family transcriptional regulator